ncbi:MAG: hypothetical protein ACI7YS_17680 [Flavobacterium sp.]
MKTLAMIVLTIFLGKSCSEGAKNDLANASMHYNAHSRGYYLDIVVANKKASVVQGRAEKENPREITISDKDWNELVGYFEKIDLEKLPEFKEPTQKRFYDGAPAAQLIVRYKDKNYESKFFDHGTPPLEIEKLVNKIVSFEKKEIE